MMCIPTLLAISLVFVLSGISVYYTVPPKSRINFIYFYYLFIVINQMFYPKKCTLQLQYTVWVIQG